MSIIAKPFAMTIDVMNPGIVTDEKFRCKSGDSIFFEFTITQNGEPKDLTNCRASLIASVILKGTKEKLLLEQPYSLGGIVVDESMSMITITPKAELTAKASLQFLELMIYDDDEIICSTTVRFLVVPSINGDVMEEIEDNVVDVSSLLKMLDEHKQLVQGFNKRLERVETLTKGEPGDTPLIGANGNWWIAGTDTGLQAIAENGFTPEIGPNENWWINGVDTGLPSRGASDSSIYVGDLSELKTKTKENAVKAINEIVSGLEDEEPQGITVDNYEIIDTKAGGLSLGLQGVALNNIMRYQNLNHAIYQTNGAEIYNPYTNDSTSWANAYQPLLLVAGKTYTVVATRKCNFPVRIMLQNKSGSTQYLDMSLNNNERLIAKITPTRTEFVGFKMHSLDTKQVGSRADFMVLENNHINQDNCPEPFVGLKITDTETFGTVKTEGKNISYVNEYVGTQEEVHSLIEPLVKEIGIIEGQKLWISCKIHNRSIRQLHVITSSVKIEGCRTSQEYYNYAINNKQRITTLNAVSTDLISSGLTVMELETYLYIIFDIVDPPSIVNLSEIQIEQGTARTEFEPYQYRTRDLTTNEKMLGIEALGGDMIVKNQLIKAYTSKVFDGSENWEYYNSASKPANSSVVAFRYTGPDMILDSGYQDILCNRFDDAYNFVGSVYESTESLPYYSSTIETCAFENRNGVAGFSVCIKKNKLTGWNESLSHEEKTALFVLWLMSNPLLVVYKKYKPTITTINNGYISSFPTATRVSFSSDFPYKLRVSYSSNLGSLASTLADKINDIEDRLNNFNLQEVEDSRVAHDGSQHNTLDARLKYDFEAVESDLQTIAAEVALASIGKDGTSYTSLAERLDKEKEQDEDDIDAVNSRVDVLEEELHYVEDDVDVIYEELKELPLVKTSVATLRSDVDQLISGGTSGGTVDLSEIVNARVNMAGGTDTDLASRLAHDYRAMEKKVNDGLSSVETEVADLDTKVDNHYHEINQKITELDAPEMSNIIQEVKTARGTEIDIGARFTKDEGLISKNALDIVLNQININLLLSYIGNIADLPQGYTNILSYVHAANELSKSLEGKVDGMESTVAEIDNDMEAVIDKNTEISNMLGTGTINDQAPAHTIMDAINWMIPEIINLQSENKDLRARVKVLEDRV